MAQSSLCDNHGILEGMEDDYSDKDDEDCWVEDNEIGKFFPYTLVFYR